MFHTNSVGDTLLMAMDPKIRTPWYKEIEPHQEVFAVLKSIDDTQSLRSSNNLRYARLYGNLEIAGLSAVDYYRTGGSPQVVGGGRLTWNIIKSMVDTVTSKIGKNKPRPVFLTSGGDYKLQQKAKKLSSFVQGVFYETDAYTKGALAFRNAGIFGDGFLKMYVEDGRIKIEQVISDELTVDQAEAIYGRPRSMFQRKAVDRAVLLSMFSDDEQKRASILAANPITNPSGNSNATADLIQVVEAWHLPSSKEAKDGKHAVMIQNCTLTDEPYTRQCFPFVHMTWTPPVVGYYGIGLAEELIGIQVEINKLLRQIQLSHHLLSTPKIFLEQSSQVVSAHMNNEIGAIIKFRGTPPTIHSFQTVHPEIYQHLERLYSRAYEIAGVSALSAQAKKPAGLDSGRALREFSDIENERWAVVQQRWETMFVEMANQIVELGNEITGSGSDYTVLSPNKRLVDSINFKDIKLDQNSFILQCYPTNFLPQTPAGRLQSVQELMNSGLISREIGLSLLDFPDLESSMNLMNASYDDAMLRIDMIISDGKYEVPDPFSNLDLLKRLSQAAYLNAKKANVEEDRLEMLRQLVLDCVRLLSSAAPQQVDPAALASVVPPTQTAPIPQGSISPLAPAGGQ
jgi:hypothetical protein